MICLTPAEVSSKMCARKRATRLPTFYALRWQTSIRTPRFANRYVPFSAAPDFCLPRTGGSTESMAFAQQPCDARTA